MGRGSLPLSLRGLLTTTKNRSTVTYDCCQICMHAAMKCDCRSLCYEMTGTMCPMRVYLTHLSSEVQELCYASSK